MPARRLRQRLVDYQTQVRAELMADLRWSGGDYIPKDLFPDPIRADVPEPDMQRIRRLARSAEIRAGVHAYLASVRGVSP